MTFSSTMMKPYRRDSNERTRERAVIFIFIAASGIVFVSYLIGGEARGAVRESAAIIWQNRIASLGSVSRERADYIAELEGRLASLGSLAVENAELKRLLGARIDESERILASVIARPPLVGYDHIFIDRGISDGVRPGSMVVLGNTALGVVRSASPRTADVELFSAPNLHTEVHVGAQRAAFTADGLGSGSFRIRVPRDSADEKGDPIILPGTEGWSLGVVESRIGNSTDAFAYLYGSLSVSPRESRWVEIVPLR